MIISFFFLLRKGKVIMSKLNPQRLIFGLFLLVLIIIGEVIFGHFALPGWPAFMVMVFFFLEEMNIKKAHHILVGGAVGIACLILAKIVITVLGPIVGVEAATIIFVVLAVYSIVAFGEILPVIFNNYAFMYLTVSAGMAHVMPESNPPNPFLWIGVELIGGAVFIAGVIGIVKIMGAMAARKAAAGGADAGAGAAGAEG